jgi:hypothetical protein
VRVPQLVRFDIGEVLRKELARDLDARIEGLLETVAR